MWLGWLSLMMLSRVREGVDGSVCWPSLSTKMCCPVFHANGVDAEEGA